MNVEEKLLLPWYFKSIPCKAFFTYEKEKIAEHKKINLFSGIRSILNIDLLLVPR